MNSYLFAVLGLLLLFIALDTIFKTKLVQNNKFWILQAFVCIMVMAFDLFAVGSIWSFNAQTLIGTYIFNTPIENIIFGFSLIGISIVFFERDNRKK